MKLGFFEPSSWLYLKSQKRAEPSPVRLMVLRNCLGIIASVSTFDCSSGAAGGYQPDAKEHTEYDLPNPRSVVNGGMPVAPEGAFVPSTPVS